jgi:sugar phosphate permease
LPPEKFAIISGSTMALGTVGGMIGDIGLTGMVHHLGWETTSNYAGFFGLIVVVLIYSFVRDGEHEEHADTHRSSTFGEVFQGFNAIIKNPQIWINGAIGCLMYVSTAAFTELWAIPYFKQSLAYSPLEAASVVSVIFLGWATGGPLMGMISDRLRLRVLPITVGSAIAAIIFATVIYVPGLSKTAMHILLFLFGFASSTQVIVFAIGREISPLRSAGTAVALTNMFVMLSGVLFQPLVGLLLKFSQQGHEIIHQGAHIYSNSSYQVAFSVIPIGLLLTVLLSFFLKETRGELLYAE